MTTLSDNGFPNLQDWVKRQKPSGGVADIVNVMSKVLPELDDVPWVEGNLPTGHRITQANALPSVGFRKLNTGVPSTKASTEQFDETCGILEDWSSVDVDHAKLNGDEAAYRASEDTLKKEAFAQKFATSLFYESTASHPEAVHGLSARYPATSGYISSPYTLKGDNNSGDDCLSIWLITWEPRKVYGIFPKGSQMGLNVEDFGKQVIRDSNGNQFAAYQTKLQWKFGFAVEDYRYIVRYQLDPNDDAFQETEKGVYLALRKMLNTIYKRSSSTRFYMGRAVKTLLDAQLAANDHNPMTWATPKNEDGSLAPGSQVPMFDGVPIRVTDALVSETAIA